MTINQWPSSERPREKLLQRGANYLSNAELLAILLGKGRKGQNVVSLARQLLKQFNGIRGLFDAQIAAVKKTPGIGDAKAAQLQAALELSRRYLQEAIEHKLIIQHADDAKQFLTANLRHLEHEVFACLFLDNQHRLIRFQILFQGTINNTSVHPREVVKHTLHNNAAAIIFAHNHPSGFAKPSTADKEITELLIKSLQLIDVRVLDHFIIGENSIYSFAEQDPLFSL